MRWGENLSAVTVNSNLNETVRPGWSTGDAEQEQKKTDISAWNIMKNVSLLAWVKLKN